VSRRLVDGAPRWTRRAETVLARGPLPAMGLRWSPHRLRVLAYHEVSDAAAFADQLGWLSAHTTPVTVDEVVAAVVDQDPLPDRAVLVTFDDGHRSVLEVAAPLLRERGIPAVAFVVAGVLDTDRPLWWTEVRELALRSGQSQEAAAALVRRLKKVSDRERLRALADLRATAGAASPTPQLASDELRKLELDGIAVGNHSWSHPCLDRCERSVIRHEVRASHELLTGALGHPPTTFAYPNGNSDGRVKETVADAGYRVAFGFDHRLVSRRPDPGAVSRIRVDTAAPLDRFRLRVSGVHPTIHAFRGGA